MGGSLVLALLVLCVSLLGGGCGDEEALQDAAGAKIEPRYQGKPISEWIDALTDSDVRVRRETAKAFGQMGEDALEQGVPALQAVLLKRKEDGRVRINAAMSIVQMTEDPGSVVPGLVSMLKSQDLDARYRGALALEKIGPAAAGAVGDLQAIVDAYNQRNYATLSDEEQLFLATARGALDKIEGSEED